MNDTRARPIVQWPIVQVKMSGNAAWSWRALHLVLRPQTDHLADEPIVNTIRKHLNEKSADFGIATDQISGSGKPRAQGMEDGIYHDAGRRGLCADLAHLFFGLRE